MCLNQAVLCKSFLCRPAPCSAHFKWRPHPHMVSTLWHHTRMWPSWSRCVFTRSAGGMKCVLWVSSPGCCLEADAQLDSCPPPGLSSVRAGGLELLSCVPSVVGPRLPPSHQSPPGYLQRLSFRTRIKPHCPAVYLIWIRHSFLVIMCLLTGRCSVNTICTNDAVLLKNCHLLLNTPCRSNTLLITPCQHILLHYSLYYFSVTRHKIDNCIIKFRLCTCTPMWVSE